MAGDRALLAKEMFDNAYRVQMQGDIDLAADLYKRSLDLHPTAEAHTYLGWAYHFQGKTDEAIEECKKAIALDPDFGNPYNDIGAYLIELGNVDESVAWLEKAISAPRYEPRHYPWYNLGRVYLRRELYSKARQCFQKALELEPRYTLAEEALRKVKVLVQ